MNRALSYHGQRRVLFIALSLIVVVGVTSFLFVTLALYSEQEGIMQSLNRLANFKALIAFRPQLEEQFRRVNRQTSSMRGIVPGASAPLAAANMQSEIKNIVAHNEGELRSSQSLPPLMEEGFEKIEISYDIALPADHLKDFIYQLETHTPYFFIDKIDLQAPQNISLQHDDLPTPRLEIRWAIHGYRLAGG